MDESEAWERADATDMAVDAAIEREEKLHALIAKWRALAKAAEQGRGRTLSGNHYTSVPDAIGDLLDELETILGNS